MPALKPAASIAFELNIPKHRHLGMRTHKVGYNTDGTKDLKDLRRKPITTTECNQIRLLDSIYLHRAVSLDDAAESSEMQQKTRLTNAFALLRFLRP